MPASRTSFLFLLRSASPASCAALALAMSLDVLLKAARRTRDRKDLLQEVRIMQVRLERGEKRSRHVRGEGGGWAKMMDHLDTVGRSMDDAASALCIIRPCMASDALSTPKGESMQTFGDPDKKAAAVQRAEDDRWARTVLLL